MARCLVDAFIPGGVLQIDGPDVVKNFGQNLIPASLRLSILCLKARTPPRNQSCAAARYLLEILEDLLVSGKVEIRIVSCAFERIETIKDKLPFACGEAACVGDVAADGRAEP